MLAFILIVGVLIAIYFIVNSQKRKKEEEQRRLENERIAREQQEQEVFPKIFHNNIVGNLIHIKKERIFFH